MDTFKLKRLKGLPNTVSELLSIAVQEIDDNKLESAFQFADRACRISSFKDVNALLVRATILSKRAYLADAIKDLTSANLMMHGNQNIAFSLLRLCETDFKKHHKIFPQTLNSLLRQTPKISLNSEVTNWIARLDMAAMGAAWRNDEFVIGWAINKVDENSNILIELDGNFFPVETGMPTPWLLAAGIGNGYNGFSLKLPATFSLLRIGVSGKSLWGCPITGNIPFIPSPFTQPPPSNAIDIIMPVYSGLNETLACLDSIKSSINTLPYRVVVVDDCSTDAHLCNALRVRAQKNEITLISRPINAGFSGAVNTGLAFNNSRDVVLLNADTLVFGNWLDRLRAAAYQSEDIATVTPLSNHGELLSYPVAMRNNLISSPKHAEQIDLLFNVIGSKEPMTIPAGVGFCFYIKRQVLNEVGLFDEGTFGRGYGEDTDFCLRAQAHGWRNVCAANTFVVHWGSRSFGDEKQHLVAQNLHRVSVRYPTHSIEYDQFLEADPFYEIRRNIQRQWLPKILPEYKGCLQLGSIADDNEINFILRAYQKPIGQWQVMLVITGITGLDTITYAWPEQFSELQEDILAAGFKYLELTTLGNWPAEIIDRLTAGVIPFVLKLEDYSGYCPRKYRLNDNAILCNDPIDTNACTNCIAELGPLVYGYTGIAPWRERTQHLMSKAQKISALNNEIGKAYIRRFPIHKKQITILTPPKSVSTIKISTKSKNFLRIAVLSAHSLDEGYLQLIDNAKKADEKKLAVEFIVLGSTLNDARLQQLPNIHLVGEVAHAHIKEVLRLHDCGAIANFSPCAHIRNLVANAARQANLPLIHDCEIA